MSRLDPSRGNRYYQSQPFRTPDYSEPSDFRNPAETPRASDFFSASRPSSSPTHSSQKKHSKLGNFFHHEPLQTAGMPFNPYQGGRLSTEEEEEVMMTKEERKQLKKRNSMSFKEVKAEVKIAMGVGELIKERRRASKLGPAPSSGRFGGGGEGQGQGQGRGGFAGLLEKEAETLLASGALGQFGQQSGRGGGQLQGLEKAAWGAIGGVSGLESAVGMGEQFVKRELDQRRARNGAPQRSMTAGYPNLTDDDDDDERVPPSAPRRKSLGREAFGAAEAAVPRGVTGLGSIYAMAKLDPPRRDPSRRQTLDFGRDEPQLNAPRRRKSLGQEALGAAGAAVLGGAVGLGSIQMMNKIDPPRRRFTDRSQEPDSHRSPRWIKDAQELAGAAAVGIGSAYAINKVDKRLREGRSRDDGDRSTRPLSVGRNSSGVPISVPLDGRQRAPATAGRSNEDKSFLSELTKSEHVLIQHAAAALLLREPGFEHIVVSVEEMVQMVESRSSAARGATQELFGVSLKTLLKFEATDSHHGAGPGTIKIPTFVDHIITAMMEMDATVEGILRKVGNMHQLTEIVNALNSSGGDGFVVDLSQLDPIQLGSLFKKFLRELPDPVLTARLFKMFVAAAQIKPPAARKRAMHLVVCMMPKANRDLMEVVFLFLDWLSTYAHVTVKIGNQMDLSNIAIVMAPTLLRPEGREPRQVEIPGMIAAVLQLLEDQHILHEIPLELAHILHVEPPAAKDSTQLLRKFMKRL